jgi:hypothetical protein
MSMQCSKWMYRSCGFRAGVGEGIVVGVDEFSEGVAAVELMEDI